MQIEPAPYAQQLETLEEKVNHIRVVSQQGKHTIVDVNSNKGSFV
jgi:hypothetical protein